MLDLRNAGYEPRDARLCVLVQRSKSSGSGGGEREGVSYSILSQEGNGEELVVRRELGKLISEGIHSIAKVGQATLYVLSGNRPIRAVPDGRVSNRNVRHRITVLGVVARLVLEVIRLGHSLHRGIAASLKFFLIARVFAAWRSSSGISRRPRRAILATNPDWTTLERDLTVIVAGSHTESRAEERSVSEIPWRRDTSVLSE